MPTTRVNLSRQLLFGHSQNRIAMNPNFIGTPCLIYANLTHTGNHTNYSDVIMIPLSHLLRQ